MPPWSAPAARSPYDLRIRPTTFFTLSACFFLAQSLRLALLLKLPCPDCLLRNRDPLTWMLLGRYSAFLANTQGPKPSLRRRSQPSRTSHSICSTSLRQSG